MARKLPAKTDNVEVVDPDEEELSTYEKLEMLQRERLPQIEQASFDDLLNEAVVAESDVSIAEKETLLGVPFIIRRINVNTGNFGLFVSLTCATKDGRTVVINDGSTGIAAQIGELVKKYGDEKPILIPKGLRKSVYYVDQDTRKVVGKKPRPNSFQQVTYYLAI